MKSITILLDVCLPFKAFPCFVSRFDFGFPLRMESRLVHNWVWWLCFPRSSSSSSLGVLRLSSNFHRRNT